ncbi:hypothetical protein BDP27DRAFT_1434603 [Rhodocollybia butyracea]|uniref:Uncharacterized protein n=1 Tax=Rhodocollybia butyracea TaxID=206335 RepID=A0A9P5P2I5_9AGAR|nr:hypothetical protein BDP27DRAFT_1434603 [Rhodocollybia butyracea]
MFNSLFSPFCSVDDSPLLSFTPKELDLPDTISPDSPRVSSTSSNVSPFPSANVYLSLPTIAIMVPSSPFNISSAIPTTIATVTSSIDNPPSLSTTSTTSLSSSRSDLTPLFKKLEEAWNALNELLSTMRSAVAQQLNEREQKVTTMESTLARCEVEIELRQASFDAKARDIDLAAKIGRSQQLSVAFQRSALFFQEDVVRLQAEKGSHDIALYDGGVGDLDMAQLTGRIVGHANPN